MVRRNHWFYSIFVHDEQEHMHVYCLNVLFAFSTSALFPLWAKSNIVIYVRYFLWLQERTAIRLKDTTMTLHFRPWNTVVISAFLFACTYEFAIRFISCVLAYQRAGRRCNDSTTAQLLLLRNIIMLMVMLVVMVVMMMAMMMTMLIYCQHCLE